MNDDPLITLMEQSIARTEETYRECVATIRRCERRRRWFAVVPAVAYLLLAGLEFYHLRYWWGTLYSLCAEALAWANFWPPQRGIDRLREVKRELADYQAHQERGFE